MMTELERRALMGDPAAQRECTENGIVLRCPFCGCEEHDMISLSVGHEQYSYSCDACGCDGPIAYESDECDYPEYEALELWNTRIVPPIGRCLDCKKQSFNQNTGNTWCTLKKPRRKVSPLGFCSDFEPKEREEND